MVEANLSLSEYRELLAECNRAVATNRRNRVLSKILGIIFDISTFATVFVLLAATKIILENYWWTCIPLITFLLFFIPSTKVSLTNRDNAFAQILGMDYNDELNHLKNQIYDLEYCIECRESGKEIDRARLMISVY